MDLPVISDSCISIFHKVGGKIRPEAAIDTHAYEHECHAQVASRELSPFGGYLVEASGGLVLAAFPRPEGALRWCLSCQSAMVDQDWPEELLRHELGEEQTTWIRTQDGKMQQRILTRGVTGSRSLNRLTATGYYEYAHLSCGPPLFHVVPPRS